MKSTKRRDLLGLCAGSFALSLGFEALVVEDACRGQGLLAKAWADMSSAGVKRIQSSDLL